MTVPELACKKSRRPLLLRVLRLQKATLVILSMVVAASAIALQWFMGERTVTQFFAQLHALQGNPPIWLDVPMVGNQYYLLIPTLILGLITQVVTKLSPQPRTWSRVIVVSILLAVTIRYVLWRSLSTLNLSNPVDGVFSLGLFFMELLVILRNGFELYLNLKVKHRHREADKMSVAVIEGIFTPSVDILIPTYNEPTYILHRTIIGCQALEYDNKNIYLLDDTRRPEMKNLAKELGCEYISRADNRHAKAGNLNHAIAQTNGELIVVFDADFVPTKNFLTRTIGFFQDRTIGLVQTHQSFYNADPIARNLGLENKLTPEVETFNRYYQLLRDGVETSLCAGTSFVVRRSYLEEIDGFVTETVSEDYITGVRLSAQGYRIIYLGECLSAGLSAESMADHVAQRRRWADGGLQSFFVKANPVIIPGLTPLQRLTHLEGLVYWFTNLCRLGFLLIPLAYSGLGVVPLRTTFEESLYFFLPYYWLQLFTCSWFNYRSCSGFLSDIYSVAQCIPLSLTAIQTMLSPFSRKFRVTPKGVSIKRFTFNWTLAWPLILLWIVTAVSLWQNLDLALMSSTQIPGDPKLDEVRILACFWSAYNLLMISIALLIFLDVPKPDQYVWLNLQRVVRIKVNSKRQLEASSLSNSDLLIPFENSALELWGVSTMISEGGVEVALTQIPVLEPIEGLPVKLEIIEEGLELLGQITQINIVDEEVRVRVAFEPLNLPQYRKLVEMLFCRPGRWKCQNTPGELQSLWLLLKALFRPRVLFDRKPRVGAMTALLLSHHADAPNVALSEASRRVYASLSQSRSPKRFSKSTAQGITVSQV